MDAVFVGAGAEKMNDALGVTKREILPGWGYCGRGKVRGRFELEMGSVKEAHTRCGNNLVVLDRHRALSENVDNIDEAVG